MWFQLSFLLFVCVLGNAYYLGQSRSGGLQRYHAIVARPKPGSYEHSKDGYNQWRTYGSRQGKGYTPDDWTTDDKPDLTYRGGIDEGVLASMLGR